ncbi:MAG: ABC transporter ATP-binding protein [Defluviitaleaceae bacterium]|nr:ABC transporter ATP-binding protein [Defluviitaleaceae bacterium]
MIKIENLNSYYGSIHAIKGVNMEVAEGKITCLIGSNGAGKTTLLKSISGAVDCTGSIKYGGETELIGMSPQKVAKQAITHVPEGRQIFPGLTVRENLEVGTVAWRGFFGRKPYNKDMEEVFELFPRLKEREKQLGWSLSGGEQQMLAIGRAIMSRPKVLMLDEPSMGLAPLIIAELFEKIVEINKLGITLLLVEQNARLAMRVSHYTYVIDQGNINIHGPSEEVRDNPDVIKTYLGKFAKSAKL